MNNLKYMDYDNIISYIFPHLSMIIWIRPELQSPKYIHVFWKSVIHKLLIMKAVIQELILLIMYLLNYYFHLYNNLLCFIDKEKYQLNRFNQSGINSSSSFASLIKYIQFKWKDLFRDFHFTRSYYSFNKGYWIKGVEWKWSVNIHSIWISRITGELWNCKNEKLISIFLIKSFYLKFSSLLRVIDSDTHRN